ncbi:MAG: hydrogenase nickel incorporation protein HypA/HybF [Eubacteriales bacterium]|nr:hydrogenase nickel incorporation protein HypA/HybF [Eubacteriales bacterium]MDN5364013.1 hydrogenase nickel incorporation protein HypA/HybF [Eubacteriales bacterium]
MHETALVASILELVEQHLRQHQLQKLKKIKLLVGTMSGASPEALQFAFAAAVVSTPHQEAELEIEEVAAEAECSLCGEKFPYQPGTGCPRCHSYFVRLTRGEELLVEYIEAE